MKIYQVSVSFNFISLVTLASLLSSCSSGFRPESIEDKMVRFERQSIGDNVVPNSYVNNDLLVDAPSRAPASIGTKKSKKDMLPYNNKKLYFLTLLDQYKYMKTFSKNESIPDLIICPKFHSLLVRYSEDHPVNDYQAKKWTPIDYDKSKLSDEKYLASHPELSLPVSKGSSTPTVVDLIQGASDNNENVHIVHTAFELHLSKTYSELKELCEYGNSNNYYTFENLNTLVNKDVFNKNAKSLNTLLRTTIFSNIALKVSLDKNSNNTASRGIASVQSHARELEEEVIARLGVEWSNDYFRGL
ncbi:MAG: hypothetical protein HN576_06235 [Bacteriovoracaceae bacterium]|nr:hypothetical protein [Bacteriovoracaceae bacterium]